MWAAVSLGLGICWTSRLGPWASGQTLQVAVSSSSLFHIGWSASLGNGVPRAGSEARDSIPVAVSQMNLC